MLSIYCVRLGWCAINFEHTLRAFNSYTLCKDTFFIQFILFGLSNALYYTWFGYACTNYGCLKLNRFILYFTKFEIQWYVMCSICVVAYNLCKHWMQVYKAVCGDKSIEKKQFGLNLKWIIHRILIVRICNKLYNIKVVYIYLCIYIYIYIYIPIYT